MSDHSLAGEVRAKCMHKVRTLLTVFAAVNACRYCAMKLALPEVCIYTIFCFMKRLYCLKQSKFMWQQVAMWHFNQVQKSAPKSEIFSQSVAITQLIKPFRTHRSVNRLSEYDCDLTRKRTAGQFSGDGCRNTGIGSIIPVITWREERSQETPRRRCKDNNKTDIKTHCIDLVTYPQSSSTLWNYSKCGVYTVESEAGC
jgi:hypothetical protein